MQQTKTGQDTKNRLRSQTEPHTQTGRSLIELLICLVVLSVLLVKGVSSYASMQKRQHLIGAAQASYFFLQRARSESIRANATIHLDINPVGKACLGLSEIQGCQCDLINSCLINHQQNVLHFAEYPGITITNVSFGNPPQSRFTAPRGMATGFAGSLQLTNGEHTLKLLLSNMGRVRICTTTPPFSPYKSC